MHLELSFAGFKVIYIMPYKLWCYTGEQCYAVEYELCSMCMPACQIRNSFMIL